MDFWLEAEREISACDAISQD
ncbi:hypothetical protein [Bradyrhizobium rifense]